MEANHRVLSNAEFIEQLDNCIIEPQLFNHEAHVRLAWLQLTEKGFEEGLRAVSKAIRQLDNKYGGGAKYHHTITIAFSLCVFLLINRKKEDSWEAFIAVNTELMYAKKLLAKYYSDDILYTDVARRTYVAPDKEHGFLQADFAGPICYLKVPIILK